MSTVKKTPIAVIGTDSHLKKDNEDLVISCFEQTVGLMNELGIKVFCHGGDFFTTRNAQPEASLRTAKNIFQMFNGISYWQMPGNHDKTSLDSENSYLDVFDKYCNLITGGSYMDFDEIEDCNVRLHFIPYFKEDGSYKDYLKKALENIDTARKNVLLTHIAVTGVKNNDASEVENSLTSKMFEKFDSVLVGHYHNRSKVGKNIHYIGSMYAGNYGEDNEKGVTVLYNDGSFEYFQLDFPHYVKVVVEAGNKEELKKAKTEHEGSENNVRLVFKGEKTKMEAINKTELEELGFDIKYEDETKIINKQIAEGELIMFNRSNLKEAFAEFCKAGEIKNTAKGEKYLELI